MVPSARLCVSDEDASEVFLFKTSICSDISLTNLLQLTSWWTWRALRQCGHCYLYSINHFLIQSLQQSLLQLGQITASSILPKHMKHLNSSSIFWLAFTFCSSRCLLLEDKFCSTTLLVLALYIVPISAILCALFLALWCITFNESLIDTTSSLSSMSLFCCAGYPRFSILMAVLEVMRLS